MKMWIVCEKAFVCFRTYFSEILIEFVGQDMFESQ